MKFIKYIVLTIAIASLAAAFVPGCRNQGCDPANPCDPNNTCPCSYCGPDAVV